MEFWAYAVVLVSVIIEGPIATLIAATATSTGYLNPFGVFVCAAVGNTIADVLWYLLGYVGNLQTISRYLRWLRVQPEQIEQIKAKIDSNAPRILFVAKLTMGFAIPTLIATGLARIPWQRWLGVLLLGEFIWTGGLVIAGYFWGAYLQQLDQTLRYISFASSVIFVIIASVYIARWRQKNQKSST